MNKKVALFCPYSYPSACGVWVRVFADAKALRDAGFEVHVFSSNIIKGTKEKSSKYEEYEGIHLHRFPVFFSLGGSSLFWWFVGELNQLNPDIIHTHVCRHPHSLLSLILGKMRGKRVFLTTHAPFDKDPNRSIFLKIFDVVYDTFIGWWELKLYSKIIRISRWEIPYLKKLLVRDEKMVLISNGIDEKFITEGKKLETNPSVPSPLTKKEESRSDGEVSHQRPTTSNNQSPNTNHVLYMGRLDPVKRLEWIKYAAKKLPKFDFKIVGPLSGYQEFVSESENLKVVVKNFTKEEYISELKQTSIYVLPSIREALSLTTLEAMAMGVIPIVSEAKGPSEFVSDGVSGFVVKTEDDMVEKIRYVFSNLEKMGEIRENAMKVASEYSVVKANSMLIELYGNK